MFVSYKGKKFGYMCFKKYDPNVKDYIEYRLMDDVEIIQISAYSRASTHYVWVSTDGVESTIEYEGSLSNIEDFNKLYSYLYTKNGFTNILGYVPK